MFKFKIGEVKVLPVLLHCIYFLRITPTTSSNFKVFELERELLIAITKLLQIFGKEYKFKRALTYSSNEIIMDHNKLVTMLNSFK